MNQLMNIQGVRGFVDDNGTAQLNLEDVARGLGFTRIAASGNEVIRWERVREYLVELGVPTCGHEGKDGLPELIKENVFYRLAMKAKNEVAEVFQAKVADEILPAIRKTGSYSVSAPQTQLEILQASIGQLVDQERRLTEQETRLAAVEQDQKSIRDVVALNSVNWRKDAADLINRTAQSIGGNEHIRYLREDSYRMLDERFGVSLATRLTNKRRRMADEGVCKSKRDKLNYLDVIAEDKKLIEGYVAIVKEIAVRHGGKAVAVS